MSWQPGKTLEQVEKEAILAAYRFYDGNKTHTANSLGIAIRTLDNKLLRYDGKIEIVSAAEEINYPEPAKVTGARIAKRG